MSFLFYILTIIILIIFLTLISMVFSISETALTSININNIKILKKKNIKNSSSLLNLKKNISHSISSIIISNNLINIIGSMLIGFIVNNQALNIFAQILIPILFVIIIILFGEIIPKIIASYHTEIVALKLTPFIIFIVKILGPINISINKILSYLNIINNNSVKYNIDHEIKNITSIAKDEGLLKLEEVNIIKKALNLKKIKVTDLMIPRLKLIMFDSNEIIHKNKSIILNSKYNIFIVYKKYNDQVKGFINKIDAIKEILNYNTTKKNICFQHITKEPLYITSKQSVNTLLKSVKKHNKDLTVVIDEYGSFLGIIHLEDIIKYITDKQIFSSSKSQKYIKRLTNNTIIATGDTIIKDINNYLKCSIDPEHYTINKLILKILKYIPKKKTKIKIKNITIIVSKASKKYIDKVIIKSN